MRAQELSRLRQAKPEERRPAREEQSVKGPKGPSTDWTSNVDKVGDNILTGRNKSCARERKFCLPTGVECVR